MFTRFTRRFRAWQQDRSAIRTLTMLDDRQLADMGIVRSEIECFVRDRVGN